MKKIRNGNAQAIFLLTLNTKFVSNLGKIYLLEKKIVYLAKLRPF